MGEANILKYDESLRYDRKLLSCKQALFVKIFFNVEGSDFF